MYAVSTFQAGTGLFTDSAGKLLNRLSLHVTALYLSGNPYDWNYADRWIPAWTAVGLQPYSQVWLGDVAPVRLNTRKRFLTWTVYFDLERHTGRWVNHDYDYGDPQVILDFYNALPFIPAGKTAVA